MKHLLIFLTLFLISTGLHAQNRVFTENVSNKYLFKHTAPANDTVYALNATTATNGGHFVGILIGNPVASDSFIVKAGTTDTVAVIVLTASAPQPLFVPIDVHSDSLWVTHRKAGNVTYVFRRNF